MLLLGALVAGVLTTLAPCVLPLLPVIVGGSLTTNSREGKRRAYVIAASLGASVIIFTLLLRASTALIDIPQTTWQWLSGLILVGLGTVSVFPRLWEKLSVKFSFQAKSTSGLLAARSRGGTLGAVLTGSALGPVFSSCSPLYLYVIVTVLPVSFFEGLLLVTAYAVGLCGTLLLIALLGQKALAKVRWIADPEGKFKRILGLVFVVVGIAIIVGLDKDLQQWVVQYSPVRLWEVDKNFLPGGW